jgi:hypothetical protein
MTTKTLIIRPNEQGKIIVPITPDLLREIGRTESKETQNKPA